MQFTRQLALTIALTVALATAVVACSDDRSGAGDESTSSTLAADGLVDDAADPALEELLDPVEEETEPTPTTIEEDTLLTAGTAVPPADFIDDAGSDPYLDDLAQRCFEASALACEELYANSPLDDDSGTATYEGYGGTCAGRVAFQRPAECALRA